MVESKRIIVPKHLIKEVHEHPDFIGEVCATLKNGMYTDLIYDIIEDVYFTFSNNIELLKYIEKEKENGSKTKVSNDTK